MSDNEIRGNDPVMALQQGMRALEGQSGPLDWSQYQVSNLAEVETFLFLAKGADGKEVGGLLIRPLLAPDMLLAVTDLAAVGREIAQRINLRLPPPRAAQKAPAKQPVPVFRPEMTLPPTPGQVGAPGELQAQGEMLVADAERRRQAQLQRMQQQMAPGSIAIDPPVVYPPGATRSQAPAVPVVQLVPTAPQSQGLPPDLDDTNVEQG